MTILVITTGGTIGAMPYKDLKHHPKISTMPAKGQDFVRLALQKIKVKTRCVLMEPRDSKLIDEFYRHEILKIINQAHEKMVLITHGTDTILQTAEFFYKQATMQTSIKNSTIILTGAMIPLSNGEKSDGMMNLRFSLRQLEQGEIARGVYIVLCDYHEPETKSGWAPRLYRYQPARYEKFYDPDDEQRNRLKIINI